MKVTPLALKLPEILQQIFEFSDEESNCNSNVLVCRTWSEPCMNVIWREVTDFHRLLKLLGETNNYDSGIKFYIREEPLNWNRFSSYARRVQRVCYRATNRRNSVNSEVFRDIGILRSSSPLLPNLKILEVNGGRFHAPGTMMRNFFIFMEPTLEEYYLRIEDRPDVYTLAHNLRVLADRCPHLTHVQISLPQQYRSFDGTDELADVLLDFIKKMPNINSIHLSPFRQMIPFTSVLQKNRNLKKLVIGVHETAASTPYIESLASTSPTKEDYFVSLTTLSVVAPYSIAEEFLTNELCSLNRISISSDLRKPETPSTVEHLLETLVKKCPRMEALHLSYLSLIDEKHWDLFPAEGYIQMSHLRPILAHSSMQSFKLEHPFPVILEDEFAEEIASSWPHLRQLSLVHTPEIRKDLSHGNCFTLRALLSFARHCRNIEYLALLVAPESSTCPTSADIMLLPAPVFPRLRTLDVGFSVLHECDKAEVAWMLSQILPEPCLFDVQKEEIKENKTQRYRNWKEVKRRIPIIRMVKCEMHRLREKDRLKAQVLVVSSSPGKRPSCDT
ncbi:hypothetical protein BT96DRAFT_1014532 [Gymnopus androsaceus JB14]|uniref:F-box domain-containing protein n=1 Tax=Gymnopus androsaceus JB14 TaxID=1447944 RepID=A0A6A4IC10_9AGAR|nr:hypothetical protein BT96DRAFT_1014532 [Gymnopus androsaceus JB14]